MYGIDYKALGIGLAFGALTFGASNGARAAVFNVPAGDEQALITAINNANANGEADTINLARGTYALRTVNNEIDDSASVGFGANGLPQITTEITINGARLDKNGDNTTTIRVARSGNKAGPFRIFFVANTGDLTLRRVRVQGCFEGSGAQSSCVFPGGGDPARGPNGAAIANDGRLRLFNGTISETVADSVAGGVFNAGEALFRDSTVSDNFAGGGEGGGIINDATGALRIVRSTISDNESEGFPGGGGGIANSGILRVLNSTISGNTADGGNNGGGGILNAGSGTAVLRFVTITRNRRTNPEDVGIIKGGGIANQDQGTVKLSNSILAENTFIRNTFSDPGRRRRSDCTGTLTSQGFNIVGDNFRCNFVALPSDQVGTTNSPINPRLRALADNGGFTLTHALRANSPAIDKGSNAVCPPTDQRLVRRPINGDRKGSARCDVGAFEFAPGRR